MAKHEYERPWQVMPAKIISLALEHAAKKDDFDHQVAYLLLDIGVEAALRAYLVNQGQSVERIVFPELLKKVKEELTKTDHDLTGQLNDIAYFHGIRNKLYHQGDGVKPTKDNLKRYSDLAKRIAEEIIAVNLETEKRKNLVMARGKNREVKSLVNFIESWLVYFQESCSIVAEKVRPAYGTREFAMKLKYIWEEWEYREDDEPELRIEYRKRRIEKFNELTGKPQTNHKFVDYVLQDVKHLHVLVAFREISENGNDDWAEYVDIEERCSKAPRTWENDLQSGRIIGEQIEGEFEKIISWLENQQRKVDEWIDGHLENISRLSWPPGIIDYQDIDF